MKAIWKKMFAGLLAVTLMTMSLSGMAMADTVSDNEMSEESIGAVSDLVEESMDVEAFDSKKYIFFGDSTTQGGYAGVEAFPYVFARMRNAEIMNYASGGATMAGLDENTVYGEISRVTNLKDYDVAFIHFGVNDYCLSLPIGTTTSSDKMDVCGGLNAAITKLQNAGLKVYCIMPFPSKQQYNMTENINGYNVNSYILAMQRVCKNRGVDIIDFSSKLCCNKDNYTQYYVDSVHPGQELQNIAGIYLHEYMTNLGENVVESSLSAKDIYVAGQSDAGITMGLIIEGDGTVAKEDCYYLWEYSEDQKTWTPIKNWAKAIDSITWKPDGFKEYYVRATVSTDGTKNNYAKVKVSYHPHIKGKCQMPYEGGGYLIGVESFDNPNQSYSYEMLILDCTLLAQGKPAWTYTTGKCGVQSGNALWTIWQPQYGYYWTLFRVYDKKGTMIDEECYGFQNI